ncbi:MAG TPA: mechanosensitive ion channel family protein [Holophaga sp.]|nr:mechanosensitive ion channel family protein [Holophaga sp.]
MALAMMGRVETVRNWFERKGLQESEKLALVIFTCVIILWGVRLVAKAVRKAVGREHVLKAEAERRAKTLGSVLENTARILVLAFFVLTTLQEFGVNISPLIAGAGIAGVAVGFGAQSLVKDVIAGFFLLMENQYGVGDIIAVDDRRAGTVERMTLRITQIRDSEGRAHYVPNGSINQVVVLSKDYARALVDIEIQGDQDPDRAMEILGELGQGLLTDRPEQVLEATDVKGVEAINASGILIRTLTKTAPGAQWDVAREYRRRALLRLREAGIALATPVGSR